MDKRRLRTRDQFEEPGSLVSFRDPDLTELLVDEFFRPVYTPVDTWTPEDRVRPAASTKVFTKAECLELEKQMKREGKL